MAAKTFSFSVVDMRSDTTAEFAAEHETLDGAFRAGWALFAGKHPAVAFYFLQGAPAPDPRQGRLRMFRFRFANLRTQEFSAFIGQGEMVLEAWADGIKGTRDTFRPRQDGKARDSNGLSVLLPARPGDVQAVGRAVSRSVESFQGDETYEEERRRVRLEAERVIRPEHCGTHRQHVDLCGRPLERAIQLAHDGAEAVQAALEGIQ